MPLLRKTIIIFLSLLGPAQGQEKITYDDHIFPIFEQACLNCHNPDKTRGGLDLSTFAGTIKGGSSGKVVDAGDINSALITLTKQTAEPIMPPEGDKISAAHIDLIAKWIEGGLLENNSSTARKASKPKFDAGLRSEPGEKPEGPPPMPEHLLLEPPLLTATASAIQSLAVSPWAPLLAITAQKQVLLHHTETLELLGILPFPEGEPISLSFTPDARYLIVGGGVPGRSGITVTFDVTNGSRVLAAGREFDTILATDIRPAFDIVATGGPSRLLKLWDTQTGEQLHSVKKHTDWITALDISPDGILLASGDRNGGVWAWEAQSAVEFHNLRAHQAAITKLAFRSDSDLLASASEDGSVRFWEMNNGNEVRKIDAHPGGVTAFAFARDGSFLTAGRDLTARVWKADFTKQHEIRIPALPTSCAVDQAGGKFFVGDIYGQIHVFTANKGEAMQTIPSNPPSIAQRLEMITASIHEHQQDPQALTEIEQLRRAEKHWMAASINSGFLKTHAEQMDLEIGIEGLLNEFTISLASLEEPAALLNAKRSERDHFAENLAEQHATLSPDHLAEAHATIAALDASITNLTKTLALKEAAITATRQKIDSTSTSLHAAKRDAELLRGNYQKALAEIKDH